jgi:hypothetical protein
MTRKEGMAGAVSLAWDHFAPLPVRARSDHPKWKLLITRKSA